MILGKTIKAKTNEVQSVSTCLLLILFVCSNVVTLALG